MLRVAIRPAFDVHVEIELGWDRTETARRLTVRVVQMLSKLDRALA